MFALKNNLDLLLSQMFRSNKSKIPELLKYTSDPYRYTMLIYTAVIMINKYTFLLYFIHLEKISFGR